MDKKYYVLVGPAHCGNCFGIYKENLVPEGRFVVVSNAQYANGGYGPSIADGISYKTREKAQEVADKLNQ